MLLAGFSPRSGTSGDFWNVSTGFSESHRSDDQIRLNRTAGKNIQKIKSPTIDNQAERTILRYQLRMILNYTSLSQLAASQPSTQLDSPHSGVPNELGKLRGGQRGAVD